MVKTRKQIEVEEKEVIRRERCACGHSDFIFISIIFVDNWIVSLLTNFTY